MARIEIWIILGVALCAGIYFLPWDGGPAAWMPSEAEVSRNFEQRHEEFKVLSVDASDGDNDGIIYSIRYRLRNEEQERFAEWWVSSSGKLFGWRIDSEDLDLAPANVHEPS